MSRWLSTEEARARLARDGPNELPSPHTRSLARRLGDQLTHFMALLLWTAGALAFVARMPELAWAIWAVVLLNAAFSFWQEFRAERALAALRRMVPIEARVWRDGRLLMVPAIELVIGDLIALEEGDRISADARLEESQGLRVDLSMLTGESAAVDATERVLAGSSVVGGRALAIVEATGARTELGRIARLTSGVERAASTLEIEVRHLVRVITFIAVGMGAVIFVLAHLAVGMPPKENFLFAIGIIVANVPEGLLPTVTLALAMGAQRMARRRALLRRLSAIETLSATTVVCTDKTGTLTRNEMAVRALWIGRPVEPHEDAAKPLLAYAALCSNVSNRAGRGEGTERALVDAAARAGLNLDEQPRLRELPFDAHRRAMTVVVRSPEGELAIHKGAPVELLARCSRHALDGKERPLDDAARRRIIGANDALAGEGHRVLGVAIRAGHELSAMRADALERDLVFVGLVALIDPPREDVKEAIAICRRAGIRVTMLTGDYGLTAAAIARQIGLFEKDTRIVTGDEVARLTDEDLGALLRDRRPILFARAMPETKLRLVRAYQALGEVVAVTGDGVNDAPALRAADVGVAMGRGGTAVAREAADIVLTDDHFGTIVNAVEEGRAIYANIRKFMTYILASNIPEIVPFVLMVALGIPPALTILQILAIDLGTDMLPALALGAEAPERGAMDQPPRAKERPLLDGKLLLRAYGFLGMLEAAATMTAFFAVFWSHGWGIGDLRAATPLLLRGTADASTVALYRQATTMALLAIVACQIGNVLACRSERVSIVELGWLSNRRVWFGIGVEIALALAVAYLPPLQRVFATAAPTAKQLVALLALPPLMLGVEELRKWLAGLSRAASAIPRRGRHRIGTSGTAA